MIRIRMRYPKTCVAVTAILLTLVAYFRMSTPVYTLDKYNIEPDTGFDNRT